ncbi:MAG: response regulator [Bacteroidia bacterium]|nr:response regulator [Bacteroidia bacterium]
MERNGALIMLIEDDPGHASLIKRNLRRSAIPSSYQIITLEDGKEALEMLKFVDTSRKSSRLVVLLDLNLPVISGMELLETIKQNEHMRHIPVFVLSTTDDPQEIEKCYELGCNIYITKPVDHEQFSDTMCKLGDFIPTIHVPLGAKP